jgi:hypothetical protein
MQKLIGEPAKINHCGTSPSLITFGDRDDILGLLMPMRETHPRTSTDLRLLIDSVCKMPARNANAA